jgi:hypothetical protein
MKRLIIIACLVLALGVSIMLLARRGGAATRSSPAQDASLLVLGVTNLPAGSFTMFCLSNGTRAHIVCVPEAFEQAGAGAWVRTPLTGQASRAVRDWIGVQEELGPGVTFTFLVPPPTTSGAWRLVFMCQEQAPVIDSITDTVKHLTDAKARETQLRQFSGRKYYSSSPEIAP